MSRRSLTLLLAGFLSVVMGLVAVTAPVPYVALTPGPTYNTLGSDGGKPVITVTGRRTFEATGNLNLTTIRVLNRLTLVQALRGWIEGDLAVVPRDVIYPPDTSPAEVREQDQAAMTESKSTAMTAAFRQLGLPGRVRVVVQKVEPKAPAEGLLRAGDELTAVDARPVADAKALRALIGTRKPGASVRVAFVRAGKPGLVTLRTAASSGRDGPVRPVIGVLTTERVDYPVRVDIRLMEVGGPSAGLMFALGIIDKLTPGALTGGAFIAGTGTIDNDGVVGPIGGIRQKLIGARREGADVFLVPAGNCAEALTSPPAGLRLVKVASLKGALGELGRLQADRATTPCTR